MAGLPPIGGGPLGVAEQERKSNIATQCVPFLHKKTPSNKFGEFFYAKKPLRAAFSLLLRRQDSNLRPLGYEPNELPLLHSAI